MTTDNVNQNGYLDKDGDLMQNDKSKVFNDPIHGHIELHPLCIKIIDTPQFQRLRNIKQLGTCYLVYPGASHNRFEHSLGVCHLAGKLLRAIKDRQPIDENGIELMTDKDILCVEIAGLCHDLGHGPFSHLFDQMFIPRIRPNIKWKHEKASVDMFNYILEDNDGKIKGKFAELMHDFKDEDITFIKELIDVPMPIGCGEWPYKGREKNKSFLYEVVANKSNGIDVDKWDYFARDCYMLGMKNSFDHNRCISSARVVMVEGIRQICYRDKEAHDLYDMFHTRMTLHRKAYQHKTHNIIGTMMCDALVEADAHLLFEGQNGVKLRMSDTIHDMRAYTQLTDTVIRTILRSTNEDLQRSRDILNNIINRKLYKLAAQTQIKFTESAPHVDTDSLKNFIIQHTNETLVGKEGDKEILTVENLVVDVVKVDYGMKNKDPILKVRFYTKENQNKAMSIKKAQVSHFLPETFAEQYIRLYCKFTEQKLIDATRDAFSKWCSEKEYPKPKGDDIESEADDAESNE